MPQIDLSILNQRQTPAFYADVLANRPAAGFVGRIFISTNTFAFFRDNGTSWDLIGGPGTGTVTGSGAAGQVSFWNGASSITGSNDLFWDSVNGHLGVGTVTPGTALDVKHDQNTVVQLEQITATNDIRIAFINSGVGLWRIGSFYNAGANDFGIFDVVGAIQPVTVKKTTGQVLIGTSTVGSGKLVVASATSDNHIQIVGAAAPSLRIDSAESGPTKRIGIGLATAVNNFIQNSQNLDMCIFNGSTSAAGNMLFGIYDTGLANIQEAARISSARNFLIGTITDNGTKLQVNGISSLLSRVNINGATDNVNYQLKVTGNGAFSGSIAASQGVYLDVNNTFLYGRSSNNIFDRQLIGFSTTDLVSIDPQQLGTVIGGAATFINKVGINGASATYPITVFNSANGTTAAFGGTARGLRIDNDGTFSSGRNSIFSVDNNFFTSYQPLSIEGSVMSLQALSGGNLLIGTTTDAGQKLQVNGTALINSSFTSIGSINAYAGINGFSGSTQNLLVDWSTESQFTTLTATNIFFGTNAIRRLTIKSTGVINIASIPTSAAGLVSGDIYSNLGILTIVP
jgi:hypothetical protein